ncbi:hypothetical protein [Rhodopseudomonas palustris]|uniref:Uncharacterized protein n=1 Tax=Rhodopseudomonas palustris (strain DX-1) TaxID=652103 RepID=E6VLA1_RHOPX|nr:hypothetical protein [Rhodopseudomonas palustris]QDL96290.1 hypothetical protein FLL57_02765 [Rhodopseudomonas palustris]
MPRRSALLGQPLFRLLAINLAIGVMIAALLLGGLLYLNPGHLRDLIFADDSPGTALGLLLFGFVVTFGSAAMGSAIMAMGTDLRGGDNGGKKLALPIELISGAEPIPVRADHSARPMRRRRNI